MSIPTPGQFRAAFYSAVDSIERSFPCVDDALTWIRIQLPDAQLEFDTGTERWAARDADGYLVGEVSRQRAG